jgi:hypothetical protein
MKTFRFVAYLFYRYYSTGPTKDIPYISTLCALTMLFGLHFFQIIALFDLKNLLPGNQFNRIQGYGIMAIYCTLILLLASRLVKRSALEQAKYAEQKIKRGNLYLIVYIIVSILLIPLIILLKKGRL